MSLPILSREILELIFCNSIITVDDVIHCMQTCRVLYISIKGLERVWQAKYFVR